MPPDPPGPTITLPAAAVAATVTRPASVPSGFDEELRQLLRSRLILVHLLALAFVVLQAAMSFLTPDEAYKLDAAMRPDQGNPWRLLVPFAQSLVGAVVLWRSPGMSWRSLRLWELVFFTTHAAYYGQLRYEMLVHAVDETPYPAALRVGFRAVVSLIGFVMLILAYGVFIPNSRRRSLIGVLTLTAIPFVALAVAVVTNPSLGEHGIGLAVATAIILLYPAGIAIFAAARADALQRRAYEAERRANELGQYLLKSKLGEGGMGEVWLAEHRLLKRPCAVKFVRPELAANLSTVARFEREVQAVTGLTHFNTVRVYDYGRSDDGSFYYVMEYLDGPTLEALVRRCGPLKPSRAVYLLRQLCGALAEAHAAGLIHRDLKPGNVIVASLGGQRDVAKLLDFGLVQDLATADNRLTGAGVVLGTPAYMCPEQAGGEAAVDARGDVYSLGALAFFALTGRPPFEADTFGLFLTAHLTRTPPRVDAVRSDVPADVADIIARCLSKNPAERFQSVAELDRALAACGCADDWSAERAARWWADNADGSVRAGSEPTRSLTGAGSSAT
jgi:serine/threonine-protein kinase